VKVSMSEVWREYDKTRAAMDRLHAALEKLDRKQQRARREGKSS